MAPADAPASPPPPSAPPGLDPELINPIGLEDYRVGVPYRTIDEWFAQELKATPESIREYQKRSYYAGAWKPEYERLIEVLAGWTKHPDYPKVAWNAALTANMIVTQPVVHELPLLRVPTLLVIGLRDRTALGSSLWTNFSSPWRSSSDPWELDCLGSSAPR